MWALSVTNAARAGGTTALTLLGLTNIFGVLICGLLGERFSKKVVLSGLYLARAAVFLLFVMAPITEATVPIIGTTIGFLRLGTLPLTSGLVGHIFGTRNLSMLFGIVFLGHQPGGFQGAWLAGLAFDRFRCYDAIWRLSIALGRLSSVLHWPIEERKLSPVPATG